MDQLQQLLETLRELAQTNEPNRVALVEKAIDEYLNDKAGIVRLSLDRLCNAIEREEAGRRVFEDWSIAKDYIRSRLYRLALPVGRGTWAAYAYLSLAVWRSRQTRNAAAACSRSSALLDLRRGCFGGWSTTSGVLPLISSTPCSRIRSRLSIRDQFIRPVTMHSFKHAP